MRDRIQSTGLQVYRVYSVVYRVYRKVYRVYRSTVVYSSQILKSSIEKLLGGPGCVVMHYFEFEYCEGLSR